MGREEKTGNKRPRATAERGQQPHGNRKSGDCRPCHPPPAGKGGCQAPAPGWACGPPLSARMFSACSASVRQAASQIEAAGSGAAGGAPQALTRKHQKQELI